MSVLHTWCRRPRSTHRVTSAEEPLRWLIPAAGWATSTAGLLASGSSRARTFPRICRSGCRGSLAGHSCGHSCGIGRSGLTAFPFHPSRGTVALICSDGFRLRQAPHGCTVAEDHAGTGPHPAPGRVCPPTDTNRHTQTAPARRRALHVSGQHAHTRLLARQPAPSGSGASPRGRCQASVPPAFRPRTPALGRHQPLPQTPEQRCPRSLVPKYPPSGTVGAAPSHTPDP